MGHTPQVPYKREKIPASRLEVDMLTYQLNESRKKEEALAAENTRVITLYKNMEASYDQRGVKVRQLTEMLARQTKQLVLWKAIAITEAVACVLYATGQLVM